MKNKCDVVLEINTCWKILLNEKLLLQQCCNCFKCVERFLYGS